MCRDGEGVEDCKGKYDEQSGDGSWRKMKRCGTDPGSESTNLSVSMMGLSTDPFFSPAQIDRGN